MLVAWSEALVRHGRKRKSGRRFPSGGLVPAPERAPDDRIRTSRQPHRRWLPDELRLDERAESPLGRLLLSGRLVLPEDPSEEAAELAEARHTAGTLYAAIVGEYRSVIEAPHTTGGSGRGFVCPSSSADPIEKEVRIGDRVITVRDWPCGSDGCACARRKLRYEAAFEALYTAGQRAAKVVARVAIYREDVARSDITYLVAGLSALARHFGLTGRRVKRYS